MKGKRNPVAEHINEFNKPKTFRDRKKHPSKAQQREERQERITELHHPVHPPYKRVPLSHLLDVELPGFMDESPPWDVEGEDDYS